MKTEKNILIAFILNLAFSVFEFIGGILTGSVAIISDAVHDIGDAASIGFAFFLEKKSKKQPDREYTYGYSRYSVLGGALTTLILLFGSLIVIYNAILRIIAPAPINYSGMIIFAVIGVCVNLCAGFFTRCGDSLNQKAVNLHMLEDALGWIVVLIGAIVMHFTDLYIIDPLMSIGVAVFILINAIRGLFEILELFLEKTPHGIDVDEISEHIKEIRGIEDVHHVHVWSLDGSTVYATMHIVTNENSREIKKKVREQLMEQGVSHATLELELPGEDCHEKHCKIKHAPAKAHHHHHHHCHHEHHGHHEHHH